MIARPQHINTYGYTHACARVTSRMQHTTRSRDFIAARWLRRVHDYAQHPSIAYLHNIDTIIPILYDDVYTANTTSATNITKTDGVARARRWR